MQKNTISKKLTYFFVFAILLFSISCKQDEKKADVKYVDFVQVLDSLSKRRVELPQMLALKKQYGRFFDVWFNEIMDYARFKNYPDSIVVNSFNYLLQQNKILYKAINAHYKKCPQWQSDFENQWSNLQSELPKTPNPVVYEYMSQFSNYNTFVDTGNGKLILGFSKEMFMNDTFPVYSMLDVPEFFNRYNSPDQIPTMLIWNYLKSRYESEYSLKTMLDQAVFDGKIWALLIEVSDSEKPYELLGYTKQEWSQMEIEQGQIWKHYLQNKVLFSSDFNFYKRYFVYGMHTFGAGIPTDTPPMIGSFSGLQIVKNYMKETDCSWDELFKEHDAAKILKISGYNPAK